MEGLRTRLIRLIIVDGRGEGGDEDVGEQAMDPSFLSHLVAGLSALRGLARALRWIVAHGGKSISGLAPSNPSAAVATASSDTDLVGFLWTSIILPILQNCSSHFLKVDPCNQDLRIVTFVLTLSLPWSL